MSIIQKLLKELANEAKITQTMLARVPEDKYVWKPHEKSMNMLQLATHIAELPTWIQMGLTTDELDFEKTPYQQVPIGNNDELLAYFKKSLQLGSDALAAANETTFDEQWILRQGQMILVSATRYEMIRMSLAQTIHHRAQLGVYFRLLDIAVPATYGPSADEQGF